jgi:predicted Fe-S protein YdhL (DUF1289 family)
VDSPCIGVCSLNKNKVCVGCWRTLEEIEVYGLDETCRIDIIGQNGNDGDHYE